MRYPIVPMLLGVYHELATLLAPLRMVPPASMYALDMALLACAP